MIGIKMNCDSLYIAYVPETKHYTAMESKPLGKDHLIEILLAHGCHQVDIADAFHALELGWEFREGEWRKPMGSD